MSRELSILITTAASLGFFHTLVGPDHYLPFIVMSRSGNWSLAKTSLITFLCGIGHILSSVILGLVGVAFGIAVNKLVYIESARGSIATWLLIAFGLVYFIWGVRRAIKNKPHKHLHFHEDGSGHINNHTHSDAHVHVHTKPDKPNMTPWILFTIFIFGPCEPLIPLLMYPAAKNSTSGLLLVTAVFGLITIATMMGIVLISTFGINFLPMQKIERYNHALAGFAVLACGLAIQFLGL
jgi:sulfite exporter TauE/SafE